LHQMMQKGQFRPLLPPSPSTSLPSQLTPWWSATLPYPIMEGLPSTDTRVAKGCVDRLGDRIAIDILRQVRWYGAPARACS